MAPTVLPGMERIERLTADLDPPFAVVDEATLWRNADELVRRAAGKPIRVASKSVRVRALLERVLQRPGYAGVLAYSIGEANWLADNGFDDILVAYPSVDRKAIRDLAADERRATAITVMIDSTDHLDLIDRAAPRHTDIQVCVDVDASLRIGPVHLGVRRSPIRTPAQASRLAKAITERNGFRLNAVMFYDAQIAGMPDSSPAVRMVKRRSADELVDRRAAVVDAVRAYAEPKVVNAGGTGSLDVLNTDTTATELAAGSGLFMPTLFDSYDDFAAHPAAMFALGVVRKPRKEIATLYSGGYVASGAPGKARVPTPVWPPGLALLGAEAAGEVQTPVKGRSARALSLGDRVWLRHAKAGEMCERFDSVRLVGRASFETLPTYRGEGLNFG
ncbi:amino acid deaminase/aldolase [Solicola gregarius]|uniref:Amino acid deaminase/aldolase n=1 Tax=Solicola gregarius TaxID=2908642 RepID=A0AA46YNM9_9ACTN|nr:amino acid deaminase/aldolase [Solicola gregarius]UYM06838.1 amino acid deaminase/aldolase [Solicola gregarius]